MNTTVAGWSGSTITTAGCEQLTQPLRGLLFVPVDGGDREDGVLSLVDSGIRVQCQRLISMNMRRETHAARLLPAADGS